MITLLCGLVSSLCGFIITWCRFVFVFLASLACPVQVPRLTRYHELVRPVFRWIPVPSLARRLKATKWQKQKIPFAAKYKNRSHLSLDKWTNDSFSPFRTSRLVRNTALRTSVIDRLLLVKIDLRTKLEHCTKIESNNKKTQISGFIIQLHLLQWLDWCYEKKLADNLSYFPDDEDSEWLANIDPSWLDKSNEEKQLHDSEIHHLLIKKKETATQLKEDENWPLCLDSLTQLPWEKANGGYSSRGTEQGPCPFFH